MVKFSYNWSELSDNLNEDMDKLIKSYSMFSKSILLERFESRLNKRGKEQ